MAAGGDTGNLWIKILIVGGVLVGAANGMHYGHVGPGWLIAALLAVGGISVVFGSCEALIKCIEGVAARLKWNQFVAGTMAGLASNIPELVMLGFVIAKEPRVGFIVVMFTLHVGAFAFGMYSGLLPRDERGHARLPAPLVKLSTDLYACAAGVCLATGALMLLVYTFNDAHDDALHATDLYVLGGALLLVEVVAVWQLVKQFGKGASEDAPAAADPEEEPPSVGVIAGYGAIGVVASLVGGHAVGDFADALVNGLAARGYSEMLGALILSVFASAGAIAMIATAHAKGKYDLALANVSGWINQVPFVVLPITLILIGVFAQTGVVPTVNGGALPIDLETTSVFLLAFPPLLILWKAVQDDGAVTLVETTTMVAVFGLTLYFLVEWG